MKKLLPVLFLGLLAILAFWRPSPTDVASRARSRGSLQGALADYPTAVQIASKQVSTTEQRDREPAPIANRYLAKVDAAIADPAIRTEIRRVQPACVRLPRGSGCCVSRRGVILTAAHVAGRKGEVLTAIFPDGADYRATCAAIDYSLDVAALRIHGVDHLPFAPLAPRPAKVGDWVCAIGQPGSVSPSGRATGYQPFHVSTGHIRGFRSNDPLDCQLMGGVEYDAWTYWGHSGCPLFNERGQIVAIHNSWDSKTRLRHAVTYEAIVHSLRAAGVEFELAAH